jgi:hypothetical protein
MRAAARYGHRGARRKPQDGEPIAAGFAKKNPGRAGDGPGF